MVKEIVKSNLSLCVEDFFLLSGLSLVNKSSCKTLIGNCVKDIAANRNFVKTCDFNRNRRTCLGNSFALIVCHNSYTTDASACDDCIALVKCTVLNEYGCDRTSALVKSCLDNSTLCGSVGVCLEFFHLCNKSNHFKKIVKTFLCLCGNRNTRCIAAPLLRNKLMLCELLFNIFGICADLIHFVDGNNNRYACGFCMVDSLNCLRHNTVIGGYNEDCNISNLSTSCTHCCECLMSRCVEECNRLAVYHNSVSTDMLCDTACLACCYICVTDSVED